MSTADKFANDRDSLARGSRAQKAGRGGYKTYYDKSSGTQWTNDGSWNDGWSDTSWTSGAGHSSDWHMADKKTWHENTWDSSQDWPHHAYSTTRREG